MILPDTHTLIWYTTRNPRLGPQAIHTILEARADENIAFSAISVWEVALFIRKDRIGLEIDAMQWRQEILSEGFREIPVDGVIAARSVGLTGMHDDPADRIIVATALQGHQLITADYQILNWPGTLDRFSARR